ncbi:hypothetical protein Cgig2_031773 [Carnegiea gigantea]|uniref:Uncharacterized protein n=1 Tax=Carnegiea gigantea TaxID=171969 RepID=A0A9Q1GVF5_9CARY|nr:hypothetical protein Cgig2_031773 [Carnegiea gigantea]
MSLKFYLPSIYPIPYSHPKTGLQVSNVMLQIPNTSTSCLSPDSACRLYSMESPRKTCSGTFRRKSKNLFGDLTVAKAVKTDDNEVSSFAEEDITVDFDWTDDQDEGAPWEGAIVYRRNSSITHVEYCTTLERLGLGRLSSELSRSTASAMGLRITKAVKDYLDGTPVLISVDVTRKKQKLRLDGIIKTVITLSCNRVSSMAPALSFVVSILRIVSCTNKILNFVMYPGVMHELTLYVSPFLESCVESQSTACGLFPHRNREILNLFSPKDSLFYFGTAIIFWTIFLLGQWKHMKNVPNHVANLSLEIAHEDDGMMCGKPAAESVFSNFLLLLTEEPIQEPEVLDLGTIYGDDKSRTFGVTDDEDEEEASIDLDDRLYFPPKEKEIDISKHIRDMVHLQITINAVCDPKCRGLCLRCGTNLNISVCNCSEEDVAPVSNGSLGKLRKQMQQK